MNPVISIVIPVYNVDIVQFDKCIESILRQSYGKFEIIIVDDGSKEESAFYCDELIKKDSRISVIHQKNAGVSIARNNGTERVIGDYIMYVDADDVLAEYALEEAVIYAKKTSADMIIGAVVKIDSSDCEFSNINTDSKMYMAGNEELKNTLRRQYLNGEREIGNIPGRGFIGRGPYARLIKSGIAKSVHFISDIPIGEDVIWNMSLLNKCNEICLVYSVWYGYVIHGSSAIRKYYGNREEVVSSYLKILWDENKKYCTAHMAEYGYTVALEFYCILNYELLSEKCTLTTREKNRLVHSYLKKKPWNILCKFNIWKELPLIYKGIIVLGRINLWSVSLKVKNCFGKFK